MTVDCPACGAANEDSAAECVRCHLGSSLFREVRAATGGDPRYLRAVAEILAAVDDGSAPEDPGAGPGRLSHPLRFPAIGAPRAKDEPEAALAGLDALPALPALPPGADFEVLRHQVDEYLQLARRQGIDAADFTDRARQAILVQDRESVEVLSRELFVFLAASIGEEFDAVCAQRNDLAALVPTATPDAELDACRRSLLIGDLAGARRRLTRVAETLGDLEEQWATVQILVTEAELLAETIRELRGDPTPALGPLDAGRRLARDGRREEAEPILARATYALWSILTPLFAQELARTKRALLDARSDGTDVTGAVVTMRELATSLRHRNFAVAMTAFRRLRDLVDALPAVPEDPGAGALPPPAEAPASDPPQDPERVPLPPSPQA